MQPRRPRATAFALAAVLNVATSFAGAAEPLISLKDFVRDAEFASVKISPTGKYLAVTMPVEGRNALSVIHLADNKITGRARFDEPYEIADIWWSGPERVVATIAYGEGPLAQPRLTGQLFTMNADGSQQNGIGVGSGYADVLDPLPNEPDVVLAIWMPMYKWDLYDLRDVPVWRLNIATGKRLLGGVALPGYAPNQAVVDHAGKVRLAVGDDDDRNAMLYERRDDKWRKVVPKGAAPLTVRLHNIAADDQSVYLTSDEGGLRECLRQYYFDRRVFEDRLCKEGGAVGQPVFSLDGGALLGVVHEDGKPRFEALGSGHDDLRMLRSIEKAFDGQRVRVTSTTLDGQQFVVLVESDRNPGDFYLVERKTLKVKYLLSRRSWIDPATQSPVEAITYRARDGTTIHGFLTAREGLKKRNGPLVIMPHGGPHGVRDAWAWDDWAQALAARGYSVLQVNYRGSAGYGYAFEAAGYGQWGALMQDDLTDAVRWAVAEGVADANRVCIMGASYGGYAALMSVVREPDLYRCAIGFAGIYDLSRFSKDSDIAESKGGRLYLDKALGDRDLRVANSPVTQIERLKVPVLIAHGTKDERVPFSQAQILRKALEKHGKKYEWAEYEGEEHGFYKEANHEDFLKRSIEFLDKHTGPNAAAKAAEATQTQ